MVKGREEKDNGDRPPTIFGLEIPLQCMINEVLLLAMTDCRTKSYSPSSEKLQH